MEDLDTSAGVAAYLGGQGFDPAVPLRQSVAGAMQSNPDTEARLQAAARTIGVSPLAARFAPDQVQRQARMQAVDFTRMVNEFPGTARLLLEQDKARVAHDDIGTLQAFESALGSAARYITSADDSGGLLRDVAQAARAVASGVPKFNEGFYGTLAAPFGVADQVAQWMDNAAAAITGTPRRQIVGTPGVESTLLAAAGAEKARAARWLDMPQDAGWWRNAIMSGFQSAGQNLAMLPLGLTAAGENAMLGLMGAGQGGQSYEKARASGVGPLQSAAYGIEDAVAEIVGERYFGSVGFMRNVRAGSSAGKLFAYEVAREVPGEVGTTLWQNFNEWQNVNPDKSVADWLGEQPDAVAQTIVATLVGGATQIGTVKAIERAALPAEQRVLRAQRAQQTAQALAAVATLAEASKLRERDPATFAAFAQELADQGVPAVHVEARALVESGVDIPALAQAVPAVAQQFEQALHTGGDVVIPTGELLAAGGQFAQALAEHVRTAPDAMSKAEAEVYLKEHGDRLQAEVQRAIDAQAVDGVATASRDAVRDQFAEQLQAAGRTADVAKAEATLLASFYATQGARLGLSAQEMAERYPLRVQRATAQGAQVLEQGEGLNLATGYQSLKLGDTTIEVSVKDGHGEISMVATPKESRGQGSARAALSQVVRAADAQGLTLTLTPEPMDRSTSKAKLEKFYRSLGFVPNKGRSKDFRYTGAMIRSPRVFDQPAYHGTPYRGIEKFDTSKIGTGEGTHNYVVFSGDDVQIKNQFYQSQQGAVALRALADEGDKAAVLAQALVDRLGLGVQGLADVLEGHAGGAQSGSFAGAPPFGAVLAEVRRAVLDDPKILDAVVGAVPVDVVDNLFGSQAAAKVALHDQAVLQDGSAFDADLPVTAGADAAGPVRLLLGEAAGEAAKVLNRAAQSGREAGEAGATVGAHEGQALGQGARAQIAFGPDITSTPSVISLFKNADLSSFLHESGHYFLQVQLDLAARIEAQAREGAGLTEGEQQVLDDAHALLRWFGIQTTPEASALTQWHSLTPDEQRDMHERFARGFEAYAFEGNAPSVELQGVFQKFRAWLVSIYRQLAALKVELTPEVRAVMSRMLASEDQIRLTEQGRSLLPLFESPAQAGMTAEEWSEYQALGTRATADAIDELQGRALRDMRWLRNARGRVLRRLQREAEGQRREVRAEARTEVMAQPVYRAWAFLTRKPGEDDKLAPAARPAASRELDPSRDSLLVAIAKLGGIARDSAKRDLSVSDDSIRTKVPVFGASSVFRAEGGRTADDMLQALTEAGYLHRLDEHGRSDLRELEELVDAELRGEPQFSLAFDYGAAAAEAAGREVANPDALQAGKLDLTGLRTLGLPTEVLDRLVNLRMTARDGLAPEMVAGLFGYDSADAMARELAAAMPPGEAIEGLTDQRMLGRYGDLATPAAIERAADAAVANEARGRMIAAEAAALERATGPREVAGTNAKGRSITRSVLPRIAREWAQSMIGRLRVRDIRPGQYSAAEARAARNAAKASRNGDLATAAAEKRNELVQHYAAREAANAQDTVEQGLRYLRKFDTEGTRKALDVDYLDQIDALLERFDLRQRSNKAIDKRTALAAWVRAQEDQGLAPDIPAELLNEANRQHYRNLTLDEFRGLVDSVRQIEHLARLKHRLLTARDQREFEAVRDEIADGIDANAGSRTADTRTPTTKLGRIAQGFRRFWAAHIKVATYAHVFDGGRDDGPVWEHIIRPANEAGDRETTMRAQATEDLSRILAPVFKLGRMGGAGQHFAGIGRSLNREARLAIALNTGNEGNLQRLLDGEGWTMQQLLPVLQSLTAAEWHAVQQVWDYLDTYRPVIAAKERRVYGKEPNWVEPAPFAMRTVDGQDIQLRGGYYPVKYDPAASQRAEEHADAEAAKRQLQGAYTTATTRRSFTKARAKAVKGRPLLYTLAGLYSGVNDVVHDLSWHEWLIDVNRLLKSGRIDAAIREHYGPEVKGQFKSWVQDIAEGERGADGALDMALARLRQGISAAGLGFNVVSAAMQPLGITQSISRVGAQWIGRGVARYMAGPRDLARAVNARSDFMANRARTRFRELAELRNRVQDQSAAGEAMGHYAYWLMMKFQGMVDVPTWWGAYEKALAAGAEDADAVARADQAVIDSQGGGSTKDLSAIERGGPAQRLFTVFYSFMNTALNLGVQKTMLADTPAKRAKLAADYLLLFVAPAVLGTLLKDAITPGDAGDGDDPEKLAKRLLAAQIDYLMGLMVVAREFGEAGKTLSGANDRGRDYTGPAGLRLVADAIQAAKQIHQGEFDDALRKALVNLAGDLTGLPAAQVNRTINGAEALSDGQTSNPAALATGFQHP